ncbi:MAG: alpha-L-fucosidase [Firmicutes bacterium]|nr:alpha-L-fucosidase [Bacillota bacterium]
MVNRSSVPTAKQLEFLSWEFGVFFHFGIRSFYPGHEDWDGKPMPPSGFNPPALDCEQWCRTAARAGARYAILTAKHHDGFANWPSAYTDYSVARAPWRNGKGDVVREFTRACRKYGLKVGLYYSPADRVFMASQFTGEEYDERFIGQLGELLQNYGKIDYLWFDGCGSGGHKHDTERIMGAIRAMQPEIITFHMWDPDTVWVGNEEGYAPFDNPLRRTKEEYDRVYQPNDGPIDRDNRLLPAECDFRMRERTWFLCQDDADTVKSVDELMGVYDCSVGRGANFLINVGPDAAGRLPAPDAARLLEFGEALRRRFASPLAAFEALEEGEDHTIPLPLPGKTPVNCVVLEEDLLQGQRVREFAVHVQAAQARVQVYWGKTIGRKAICNFPTVRGGRVTVEILRADGPARLKAAKVYYTNACV